MQRSARRRALTTGGFNGSTVTVVADVAVAVPPPASAAPLPTVRMNVSTADVWPAGTAGAVKRAVAGLSPAPEVGVSTTEGVEPGACAQLSVSGPSDGAFGSVPVPASVTSVPAATVCAAPAFATGASAGLTVTVVVAVDANVPLSVVNRNCSGDGVPPTGTTGAVNRRRGRSRCST